MRLNIAKLAPIEIDIYRIRKTFYMRLTYFNGDHQLKGGGTFSLNMGYLE